MLIVCKNGLVCQYTNSVDKILWTELRSVEQERKWVTIYYCLSNGETDSTSVSFSRVKDAKEMLDSILNAWGDAYTEALGGIV